MKTLLIFCLVYGVQLKVAPGSDRVKRQSYGGLGGGYGGGNNYGGNSYGAGANGRANFQVRFGPFGVFMKVVGVIMTKNKKIKHTQ